MIEVRNLVFEYANHRALNNVSFTVEEGTITALVGPNGAGKTTLMKCISGLENPFAGSIRVDGIDVIEDPRECHRLLGFLPDFFGLYDELTVAQSLEYFARAHEVHEEMIDDRVQQTAERLGLAEKLHEKVTGLSRGMRQRLAIGQTVIRKPKYLILDEPASGLDPEARYQLGEEFIRLCKEGITLIVSSHILAELDQYATHILILKEGRVIEQTTASHFETPSDILVVIIPQPSDTIRTLIESIPGTSNIEIEGDRIEITLSDVDTRQEILKQLMIGGFEVREFFMKHKSLQDQYLEQVKS